MTGDCNHRKSCCPSLQYTMAISPVDKVPEIMTQDFGTVCLITDQAADKYLARARKEKTDQKKFTEFCGGAGGWDDFCERMGE